MARPRTGRNTRRLADHPFTMKKGFSVALCILMLALAVGSLFALVQEQHPPLPEAEDNELRVITLKGNGKDVAKLALTTYDLSIAGFANGSDHWYTFPGHEFRIPRSTPLPFGNSYRDLIGGLANLPNLPLGREPTLHSVSVVSAACDPAAADDEGVKALKRALATLTVVTSEAQRLKPIRETVDMGWKSGDARVAVEHLPYIEHWDTICHEILRANKNGGVWDGPFTELLKENADIHSLEEALVVVSAIADRNMQQVFMAHARRA